MDIAPVKDWSGPMVQIRNDLDRLSEALKKKDFDAVCEISTRIRRCLDEILQWVYIEDGGLVHEGPDKC